MSILEIYLKEMKKAEHYPVMYREVLKLLKIKEANIVVDCTVGVGSHALKFLEIMKEGAYLYGIDKDSESLKIASQRLNNFPNKFTLIKGDYSQLSVLLKDYPLSNIDIFFFDLGISSYQLNNPQRGFSFLKDGPLDMRMDRESFLCAYDLVNNLTVQELEKIFRLFGEERYARKVANFIIRERRKGPISTTAQLTRIILNTIGYYYRKERIHPATRIFQALRIAVNRELEALREGLKQAVSLLIPGGRIGVISFHSLEDRIVKRTFKEFHSQKILKIITPKPVKPSLKELEENVASRSAKLRVAEKM